MIELPHIGHAVQNTQNMHDEVHARMDSLEAYTDLNTSQTIMGRSPLMSPLIPSAKNIDYFSI